MLGMLSTRENGVPDSECNHTVSVMTLGARNFGEACSAFAPQAKTEEAEQSRVYNLPVDSDLY
jgi:hypothetical protein